MKARRFQFVILADETMFEGEVNPTKDSHTPAEMIPTLITAMASNHPAIATAQKITVSVKVATPAGTPKEEEEGLPA